MGASLIRLGGVRRLGLALILGCCGSALADRPLVETLHEFSVPEGSNPHSPPIRANDGYYYGTSGHGGAYGCGAVYRLSTAGEIKPVAQFDCVNAAAPEAALVESAAGELYGTGTTGGDAGLGTVFKLSKQGTVTRLHSFAGDDGERPSGRLVLAADGSFYGTTANGGQAGQGTIFRIDAQGNFTTLHHFRADTAGGSHPQHGLVAMSDGLLIGSTAAGGTNDAGTLFRLGSGGFETLLNLDQGSPSIDLVVGSDGRIYGGLDKGSSSTVFAYAPQSNTYSELVNSVQLRSLRGLTPVADGSLLAATPDGIWKITAAGALELLQTPPGDEVFDPKIGPAADGEFLVSNSSSTAQGLGSLWKFSPQNGLSLIHGFFPAEGYLPEGLVVTPEGRLFGVTRGKGGGQAIFTMSSAETPTVLHRFSGTDGSDPNPLSLGLDGALYGTTTSGGLSNRGAFFRLDPSEGLQVRYHFSGGDDGDSPGELTRRGDGSFFGLTGSTAFRITPEGQLTTVARFDGDNGLGLDPQGPIHRTRDGVYYGLTASGGTNSRGTLFRLFSSRAETALSFPDSVGVVPVGGITSGENGDLVFGLSSYAGLAKIDSNLVYQSIPTFEAADPQTPLALGSDGNFYGVTRFDGQNFSGTYFRLGADGTRTNLYDFPAGAFSDGLRLTTGPDGAFYAAARFGGASDIGSVLRFLGPAQAPSNLAVTRTSANSAKLTWNPGLQATSYKIFMGEAQGQPSSTPVRSAINTNEATIDNLNSGQTYYFTVVSANAIGESKPSSEVALAPSNPQLQLTASPVEINPGDLSTLSWNSSDVSNCTASDAWSGPRASSGTEAVFPTAAGVTRYTLSCTDGQTTVSSTAEILVRAVYDLQPATNTLPFGDQPVGTRSSNQTMSINNSGNAPLTVTSLSIGGNSPNDFLLITDGCSNQVLQAGESCALTLAFMPTDAGSRSAIEQITTDQPGIGANFALGGYGTRALAELNPITHDFGDIPTGASSGEQPFNLTNTGNSALTIQLISVPTGFVQTNDCPASLAASASCHIGVRFAPTGAGAYAGALTVTTNAANSPSSVALEGTGIASTEHPSLTSTDPNGRPVVLELMSPAGGAIDSFTSTAQPTFAPGGYDYLGFYSFSLSGLPLGATATVRLTLPAGSVFDTYIKCSSSVCAAYPAASIVGNQLSLMLTDGGQGDSDGLVNGRISDPGSPAKEIKTGQEVDQGGGSPSGSLLGGFLFAISASFIRRRRASAAPNFPT